MGLTGSERRIWSHSSIWVLLTVLSFSATAQPLAEEDEEEGPRRNWYFVPSIELAETYSDNINLAPSGREDWDLVTEITPGLSLHGESARVKADLDYRIQNLLYLNEPGRSTVNHRFQGNGTAELLDEHLFFDAESVVTQVALDPNRDAGYDSINSVPRTDLYSFRGGPRYQQNFGGYAQMQAGYSFGIVRYGGNASGASDSDLKRAEVSLASGRRFTRLGWSLSYYNEEVDRGSESRVGDAKHEVAVAEVSYALTRHFSVLARAGDETHEFDTRQQGFENGTYTAGGFEYRPNRHTRIQALYGDRYESASVAWEPTRRTSVDVQWKDTQVGANVGESWDAEASLRTRRTRWALTYTEEPATVQQLVFSPFIFVDPTTGIFYSDFAPGREFFGFDPAGFRYTDEVFIRRRGQASFELHTGRTDSSVIIYDEEREFTASGEIETAQGINTGISWRFAPRTSALGNIDWSRRELRTSASEYDVWRVETGLQHDLASDAIGVVTVSHGERSSGSGSAGYTENRISVRLFMQF